MLNLECPDNCVSGKCSLKSTVSNENDATECSKCIDGYYLENRKCLGTLF